MANSRLAAPTVAVLLFVGLSSATAQEPDLRAWKTGDEVEIEFLVDPMVPRPVTFNVYRGPLADVRNYAHQGAPDGRCGVPGADTGVVLAGDLAATGSFYYLVSAVDDCGAESLLGASSLGDDRPNTASCGMRPTVAVLGGGTHDMSNIIVTEIVNASADLDVPRDLEFNPDAPNELWIVNRATHSAVIVTDPGLPTQSSIHHPGLQNGRHFMAQPSALAFGQAGSFATSHEEDDFTQGLPPAGTPADFMGPTLWTSDSAIFEGGHWSHLDMLHNSPNSTGIAWEAANAYWVNDGWHASLTRYDFHDDHGLGGTDHRDGEVTRYAEGEIGYVPDVVSHVVFDPMTGHVIAADTGNSRLLVLDPSTGTNSGPTFPNYDGSTQTAVTGSTTWSLTDPNCVPLVMPSGLELHDGMLFVSDNSTSMIYALAMDGTLIDYLDTGFPPGTLMGMAFHPTDGSLYLVDVPGNRVLRLEPR